MVFSGSGLLLLPFLAAATWYDWRERRIPNWVTVLGLAVGLAAGAAVAAWVGGGGAGGVGAGGAGVGVGGAGVGGAGVGVGGVVLGLAVGLARALAAVLLTGGLYLLRMVGAGDIKLMAMIVGCLGFRRGGAGILAGLCLGAVWSLVKLVRCGILPARLRYFADYVQRYVETGRAAPYYRKGEDGEELVIPLGACIAAGSGAVIMLGLLL